MNKPLIIAHRGASQAAPENTVAAANLAWKMGSDAVEIDIRLTADRQIVVMHDADTGRTTGENHPVSALPLAELKKLDAGAWKGDAWKGEPVSTLREILATVPAGKKIVIEIKDTSAILAPLKKELDECGLDRSQIFLMAFDHELTVRVKALFPDCTVLWLTNGYARRDREEWPQLTQSLIEGVRSGSLDGISFGACGPFSPDLFLPHLERFVAAGIPAFAWTINDEAVARCLVNLPMHGITTDVPDLLLGLRGGAC